MISLKAQDWQIDNIETILFDKDGTFIDLHYFWGKMTELRCLEIIKIFNLDDKCFKDLALVLGYDILSGKMLSNGITALYSRSTIIKIFRTELEKFDVYTTEEKLAEIFDNVSVEFYKEMTKYTKPINEAVEFIKKLRAKGIKLGIVTSDSVESTRLTIDYFGWNDLFDCFVGRESSTETKESGALTKIALEQLNVNPKTTIMVGDAPMDYFAAKNANVEKTILVASGQISFNELQKTSCYVVNSLNEVVIVERVY